MLMRVLLLLSLSKRRPKGKFISIKVIDVSNLQILVLSFRVSDFLFENRSHKINLEILKKSKLGKSVH